MSWSDSCETSTLSHVLCKTTSLPNFVAGRIVGKPFMDTPQIYIACLASYNNGIFHGQWIDVTQNQKNLFYQAPQI
ncbi:Antirestriction protein [Legionella pneumophila]|nr:Antirestriction protein [Legionella pneumophila]